MLKIVLNSGSRATFPGTLALISCLCMHDEIQVNKILNIIHVFLIFSHNFNSCSYIIITCRLCPMSAEVCIISTSLSVFGSKCNPSVWWHGELSFLKQVE